MIVRKNDSEVEILVSKFNYVAGVLLEPNVTLYSHGLIHRGAWLRLIP